MKQSLGYYIKQIRGVSYKPTDLRISQDLDAIPILRANNITDEGVDYSDLVYVSAKCVKEDQLLKVGDILICASSGSKNLVGKAAQITSSFKCSFGAFCKVIRAKDVEENFLGYFFQSPYYRESISNSSAGANINNIRGEDIDNIEIDFPEETVQQKVVNKFNKLYSLILKRKQQLEKLDLLVKSQFIEMFGSPESNVRGFEISTVGQECVLKSGTSLPSNLENEGGTIPYVKVGDMTYNGCDKYITESSHMVTSKTAGSGLFPIGCIIFPKRGGAIGTNKKRLLSVPICADLNIMGVIPGERVNSQYLYSYFINIDLGKLNNGSSVPQINNKDIAPLRIIIPPMELQKEYSHLVEQTDKSKFVIKRSLEKLETLKKVLMQKYFG